MKIRFYLDTANPNEYLQKVVDHFDAKEQADRFLGFSGERVGELTFHKDDDGIYVEGRDFLTGAPTLLEKNELPVLRVSLYDEGTTGRPALGLYESEGGATALVDQFQKARRSSGYGMMGDEQVWVDETAWRIRVVADSLKPAVELYRAFRRGELEPSETWSDLAPAIKFLQDQNTILQDEINRLNADREGEHV